MTNAYYDKPWFTYKMKNGARVLEGEWTLFRFTTPDVKILGALSIFCISITLLKIGHTAFFDPEVMGRRPALEENLEQHEKDQQYGEWFKNSAFSRYFMNSVGRMGGINHIGLYPNKELADMFFPSQYSK